MRALYTIKYLDNGSGHRLSLIKLILYIWHFCVTKINILCIIFKLIAFFIITLFTRLYVRVGILLTSGKHLHDSIILLRGEVWANKTSLTPPFLLKCLYQARKVNGHVFVGLGYQFYLFLRYFYLIFKLIR
jgi:hypothetical protein